MEREREREGEKGKEGGREGERERGRGRGRGRGREKKGRREGGREKGRSETDHRNNGAAQTTHAQFDFRIPHLRRGPPTYKKCFRCVRVASALFPSTCLSDISPLTIEQFSISPPPADPEWLKRKQQAKFREELPL